MKKLLLSALAISSVLSVRAATFEYVVYCTGPKESPANSSPGTGIGKIVYDNVAHTLQMQITFTNLNGTVTQTHIHAATASPFGATSGIAIGNSSLPGFPLTVTSGVYSNTLDLTSTSIYPSGYVSANGGTAAGAEAAVMAAINAGKAYWNIHSSSVGSGEIRSFPILSPNIRVVKVDVGANIKVTSTLTATNGLVLTPEYSTNMNSTVWTPLTVTSSSFLNGTNEMICGLPPTPPNPAFLRVRALLAN